MGSPHRRLTISAMPENPVSGKAALTAKQSSATATKKPPSVSNPKEISLPFHSSIVLCRIIFPSFLYFGISAKKEHPQTFDMIRKCSFLLSE